MIRLVALVGTAWMTVAVGLSLVVGRAARRNAFDPRVHSPLPRPAPASLASAVANPKATDVVTPTEDDVLQGIPLERSELRRRHSEAVFEPARRRRRWRTPAVVAAAGAAFVLLPSAGAAAATGSLPPPVQRVVSSAVALVGADLPSAPARVVARTTSTAPTNGQVPPSTTEVRAKTKGTTPTSEKGPTAKGGSHRPAPRTETTDPDPGRRTRKAKANDADSSAKRETKKGKS